MFLMSYGYNPAPAGDQNHGADLDSADPVTAVTAVLPAHNQNPVAMQNRWARRRPRRGAGKRVGDYLPTVERRVRETNLRFRTLGLPYQCVVYTREDESVVLEVRVTDGKGNVVNHLARDVTDENFGKLMDDVSSAKGLIVDSLPSWGNRHG